MNIIIICYLIIAAFLAGMFYTENIMMETTWSRKWWNDVLATFILSSLWPLIYAVVMAVKVKDYIALDLDVESYWRIITRKKLTQRQIKIVEQLVIDGTLKKNKTLLDRHKLFVAKLLLKYNRP